MAGVGCGIFVQSGHHHADLPQNIQRTSPVARIQLDEAACGTLRFGSSWVKRDANLLDGLITGETNGLADTLGCGSGSF